MTTQEGAHGVVWSATWVAAPSPIEGIGNGEGYAVAFVTVGDTTLQVLVDAERAPVVGVGGVVSAEQIDGSPIDVFTPFGTEPS